MSISEISSGVNSYAANNNDDPLSLKVAIKAYKDEWLTGLTDKELEEINKEAEKYLKAFPIKTDADRAAFNTFIKSLLKKYGYKGDIDEYAATLAAGAEICSKNKQTSDNDQAARVNHAELFKRAALGSMSAKNKLFS